MTTKTKALELGYFVTELADSPTRNYQALIRTIEDGVILPSEWITVDETGEPAGMMDVALGCAQYISFTEIPEQDGLLWDSDIHGLGFTQDFLENQGVEPVEYLTLSDLLERREAAGMLAGELEALADDPDAYLYVQSHLRTIAQHVQEDPEKQALLRERIAAHANDLRTYHEVVDEDDDIPREWRVTQAVHFTLDDVQTVYVASSEEVCQFRLMYPSYQGTFVILD